MRFSKKPPFKEGEPERTDQVLLSHGAIFGVVGSTHGDAPAHAEMIELLLSLGAADIFHCGDITGEMTEPEECVRFSLQGRGRHCVQGNHDVLAVGKEHIHTYDEYVTRTAQCSARDLSDEARELLANAPARIETPFFTIVHESVSPPYYAKRSKKRRRNHGWDIGSTADENTTAVCYGRIDRPHFIGADHAAYIIDASPRLKVTRPRPGEEVTLPRKCVVSVPSVTFSRDDDYNCGGILGVVLPDGLVKVRFLSITPREHSPQYQFPGETPA
jgi:predicted phosphodiesterase